MTSQIVYEVRTPFGTVLFTNLEAAKAYRLECGLSQPSFAADPNIIIIAPRVVLEKCPGNELALAG